VTIDSIDRSILRTLAADGRITFQSLAETCSLSPNAAAARVRRLKENGVISGFGATIDRRAFGRDLEAVVDLRLVVGADPSTFERSIAGRPEVVRALHLTGDADYQLHIATTGTTDLDRLIRFLKSECEVAATDTRIVLGSIDLDPTRVFE
jgi:Lrp/AsnC family leucine-responsive transcriptional regulator